ncbi:Methylthioribose-1-phosphate isomerase [Frankliniella fusca]|uniref:Methylthioribose-1-phosphate isomerase n=1 Tax=Frankliniella fusca TaxID=407009 RepID=A0AAE1HJP5_9NEOP|nr:Methylthioribose-1-phosphate isomerase [Frankliniella fusca]
MVNRRAIVQDGMRRRTKIYHFQDGHSYHANRVMKGGRTYMKCHLLFKRRCNGAGSLGVDGDFHQTIRHNHPQTRLLIHERRLRHAVLNRCRAGDLSDFFNIYHEERRKLKTPKDAAVNLPLIKLRPCMQRAREDRLPHIPHTLSQLSDALMRGENAHITQTLDGEDNLFAGVVGRSDNRTRCVLLFSKRKLKYMSSRRRVQKVFCDGTFVVPSHMECSQIWTLITLRRNHIIVLGWVLMQSWLKIAYQAALEGLRRLAPGFQPTQVICDFERAEKAAWKLVYPNAHVQGCHFHFSKAVCEYAKYLGLRRLLRENNEADSIVRSLCAIPFLPREWIVQGYNAVVRRLLRRRLYALEPLFTYFANQWLCNPEMISNICVFQCDDRTNNACESSNRTLRGEVRHAHPNVWHLIGGFVRLEDIAELDIAILSDGGNPTRRRRASAVTNDLRIEGLYTDLLNRTITISEFLRRASRRVQGIYDEILH